MEASHSNTVGAIRRRTFNPFMAKISALLSLIALLGPALSGHAQTAASISSNPTNKVATLYGNATFVVGAQGTAPLSYTWLFNGASIPGGTSASLTITNVQTTNTGNYAVAVSNQYGGVISSNA